MKIQLIFDEQKRGDFDVNGPAEIYKALRAQNIRSEVLLFDRAIDMCFERKFDEAEILIQSLLLLHPRDKNANILLIKILSAQKKFTQARQEIQKAKGRGTQIPSNIRMYVDEGIKRDEIKKRNEIIQIVNKEKQKEEDLRNEIKKLRRERETLQSETLFLAEQTKKWYLIASCIAGFGLFIIIALPYLIGDSESTQKTLSNQNISEQKSKSFDQNSEKREKIKNVVQEESTTEIQNNTSLERHEKKVKSPSNNSEQSNSNQDQVNEIQIEKEIKNSRQISDDKKSNLSESQVKKQDVHTRKEKIRKEKTTKVDPNPSRNSAVFPFTYIVQRGDTLDKIAERYYGKKSEWKRIAENNDVSPRNLQIGQKLTIVEP